MSIPRITPYPLPSAAELPVPRAAFAPDPARAVLLVHDMQEHFVDYFARGESPLAKLLPNIARLRDACDARGVPVIYSAQPGDAAPESRGLLNPMWGPGILARPELGSIVAELAPRPHHTLLAKHRYSAMHGTALREQMNALGRDQLWICGVYAHIGCLLTATDAFMCDVQPFLVADALGDFSREQHDQALSIVADCCGVVLTTEALCSQLEGPQSRATALLLDLLRELAVEVEAMGDDDLLQDFGLDSVRLVELSERLAGEGVPVEFMDMVERFSLGAMREYVRQAEAEQGA